MGNINVTKDLHKDMERDESPIEPTTSSAGKKRKSSTPNKKVATQKNKENEPKRKK